MALNSVAAFRYCRCSGDSGTQTMKELSHRAVQTLKIRKFLITDSTSRNCRRQVIQENEVGLPNFKDSQSALTTNFSIEKLESFSCKKSSIHEAITRRVIKFEKSWELEIPVILLVEGFCSAAWKENHCYWNRMTRTTFFRASVKFFRCHHNQLICMIEHEISMQNFSGGNPIDRSE